MAISVVQFSSYLLSLGRFTYLLACPFIVESFHVFFGTPIGAIGGWQLLIMELNTHTHGKQESK